MNLVSPALIALRIFGWIWTEAWPEIASKWLSRRDLVQQCVGAMRVSDIKVLEKMIESARNICFLLLETRAFAFGYLIPGGSWDRSSRN